MKSCVRLVLTMALLAGAGCATSEDTEEEETSTVRQSLTLDERIALCSADPRVQISLVSVDTCVGADLFFRETFNGNGRSCATCHPVDHNFTIDPAFIATLPSTDPLFVAENNPTLAKLEIPPAMRQFGVILENVDGFSNPTVVFTLRSVPHTLSLATSITNPPLAPNPPANRTGWSGDGAPNPGALRDFQTGAITQHYTKSLSRVVGTDFRLATSGELDRIDRFMRQLGRLNELDLSTVVVNDAGASAGRTRFLNVGCNACHVNAGANASFGGGGNRNFNTGVESVRISTLATFPRDGGFGLTANNDGTFGDATFNAPPVIEAADTGPFFHTATTISGASAHNVAVANTIEEAVAFYDSPAFNGSPSGQAAPINLTAAEIDNIGRFLRVLNAAFNIALASRRIEAVGALLDAFPFDENSPINDELIRLSVEDARDAVRVLAAVPNLNLTAQSALNDFIALAPAFGAPSPCAAESADCTDSSGGDRLNRLRTLLATARTDLGSNMVFQIGQGTLMF